MKKIKLRPQGRIALAVCMMASLITAGVSVGSASTAAAAAAPTLNLRVLVVGSGSSDPTTAAWEDALTTEGVPYTEVDGTGAYGSEQVVLPAMSSGTTGNFNGVVLADSPTGFAAGQLSALDSYESSFGVRQVDGYMYPDPDLGVTAATSGDLGGTSGTLTTAGLAAFPELQGPVPFDTAANPAGTYGYSATVTSGAPYTAYINNSAGQALAGVYQHPVSTTDPQSGVSELSLYFDYNSSELQWLLLAPGLINWVTADTHLGLDRNYFGEDIDDNFIADNEWSSQFQCTPAATDPPDYTCPVADQGVDPGSAPGVPKDVQMTAADVAYVVNWEQQTGITLNMAFNGVGACTASDQTQSNAVCTGTYTEPNGTVYTLPGATTDSTAPADSGLVNALLADKADFNWIIHTWSHLFLGCTVWQPQALTSLTANPTGGTFSAGAYNYEITAATAYGESEPSTTPSPTQVTVGADGSVTLVWPEATNGYATDGTPGPSLAQEEADHTGGTGFWGYNVYREDPGSTTYGLVGQVAENPAATSATTYSFTDTGTTPGAVPDSGPDFPTATNPGIDCANDVSPGVTSWTPVTDPAGAPDTSIDTEIGLDQAFAAANSLPNYTPAAVVTGEHSGVENPNMPAALAGVGVTTFAQDASRQPQQFSLGAAIGAPRYPNNIYYNASNWADELNEYNTLYVAQGDSLGDSAYPSETGHCVNTSDTTCITTPATEADFLASESHIMLSHVLDNNPRMTYDHQPDLMGPDYTVLTLISNMLSQYNSWYNASAPVVQMTDVTEAQVLAEQDAWTAADTSGSVTASETNGAVTVTNSGSSTVNVPITAPPGTTVNGSSFGESYGGSLSAFTPVAPGTPVVLNATSAAPAFTSANNASLTAGTPFSFTVTTTGTPTPALSESGTLPAGITFVDNGNGTATIAGTASAGTAGTFALALGASNSAGTVSQPFTLTAASAPAFTSAASATSIVGVAFSFNVTTSGSSGTTVSESGALPQGLSFLAGANGTGTISGTPSSGTGGPYPITLTATNGSGTATQAFTLTNASAPSITSASTAVFSTGVAGTYTVTTTGYPAPTIGQSGALPTGMTFTDNGDGTATITGTPAAGTAGSYPVTITATNASASTATLSLTITVNTSGPPTITSGATADFTLNQAGSAAITTTGSPTPHINETGALPAGLSLVDNGNGTALISGTPTATGTTGFTVTAANGVTPDATQAYTVVVGQAPAFTSANTASTTVGSAFSFTITAGGYPAPSWGYSNLPPGVTFTDNGDGTATLSGSATTAGTYAVPLVATNGTGSANQTLTITVTQAPAITSANSATFTIGTGGSFSVTTTGSPTAAISEAGALPSGVTLVDNGNGTATLAGTPAAGTTGTYPITVTAANGVSPNATQAFTLTVNAAPTAPAVTSANAATFTVGTQGTFSVTTTGSPTAAISEAGALPSGVTLVDNGNGTATLAGTPAAGSNASYPITITAANGVSPNASQAFTLTVNPATAAPTITSGGSTTFGAGQPGTFTVTTTGSPTAALSTTSNPALPSGVTFKDNANGTATLAGTAPAGTQGTYVLTVTAQNSAGTATQSFTLTVNSGLAITSAAMATATAGKAFSFTVTASGTPAPTLSRAGTLPPGITFTANPNGTATLAGTPTATDSGPYSLTFSAKNSTGTTSQNFVLTVDQTPTFNSAATVSETAGTAFTFTVSTKGYPNPTLSARGLPAGVTFSDNGNATGSLSGTTTVAAGTYSVAVTATNAGGSTNQTIALTVKAAGKTPVPTFTSAASATATAGTKFSFSVTTVGSPTTYTTSVTHSGTLPAGVSFSNNGNGTATLTGTPTAASGGTYPITFTATNTGGTTTQSFVLTVSAKPTITTAASATATVGSAFTFTVGTTGAPAPKLTETGALPQGVTWTDNGNGTASLSGTPGVAQGAVYKLTFNATNTFGSATQAFTLTVNQAPAITSAATAPPATHAKAFSFTFTASGYPLASVTHTGTVKGLTFTNNGNGTATLAGTPTTAGTYSLTITAKNSVGSAAQTFTLKVS